MGRGKDRFIEHTGGLRIGETQAEFRSRQEEISKLRERIYAGVASPEDIEKLGQLLGSDENNEDCE